MGEDLGRNSESNRPHAKSGLVPHPRYRTAPIFRPITYLTCEADRDCSARNNYKLIILKAEKLWEFQNPISVASRTLRLCPRIIRGCSVLLRSENLRPLEATGQGKREKSASLCVRHLQKSGDVPNRPEQQPLPQISRQDKANQIWARVVKRPFTFTIFPFQEFYLNFLLYSIYLIKKFYFCLSIFIKIGTRNLITI